MDQLKQCRLFSMNPLRKGTIHIIEGQDVTIGRSQDNTNPINDYRIADFHCSISFKHGNFVLKNLCTQGTYLDKEKMIQNAEVNLKDGDIIYILKYKPRKVPEKDIIAYLFVEDNNKNRSAQNSQLRSQPQLEQKKDELTCTICFEIVKDGVLIGSCGHQFCGSCLNEWEKINQTCPCCRTVIRNKRRIAIQGVIEQTNDSGNDDEEIDRIHGDELIVTPQRVMNHPQQSNRQVDNHSPFISQQSRQPTNHNSNSIPINQNGNFGANLPNSIQRAQAQRENNDQGRSFFQPAQFQGGSQQNRQVKYHDLYFSKGQFMPQQSNNQSQGQNMLHLRQQQMTYQQALQIFSRINNSYNPFQRMKQEQSQFNRPDCAYGQNCPIQHQMTHASQYNHMCQQTRFD